MTETSDDVEHRGRLVVSALPFHRLTRESRAYRWWKPLLVGLVAAALYLVTLLVAFVALAVAGLVVPTVGTETATFFVDPEIDLTHPVTFALVMLSIILMLPALLLATRIFGMQRVGTLSSVVGGLRWTWLLRCLGLGAAVFAAGYVTIFVIDSVLGESAVPRFDDPQLPVLMVLALLLVPMQAAAEEYVFRGYLVQTIGGWLRHPAFAVLLPVPLFVLGHDYGLLGQVDIAAFAVVAGWLTWRTGGLEAAIGLHVVNNVTIFALGTLGMVDPNATDLGLPDLMFSLAITLAGALVLLAAAKRHNITRLNEHSSAGQPVLVEVRGALGPGDQSRV